MSANVDTLVDGLLADCPPAATPAEKFLGEQYDRGLAWVHFPTDSGGLGLTPKDQQRAQQRLHAGGAPAAGVRNPIGYGMCAPTIVTHGTTEQKVRYLRPLFTNGRYGASSSASPAPAPTSLASRRGPSATGRSGA